MELSYTRNHFPKFYNDSIPSKKNQHFVPRLCLRAFSLNNNKTHVGLFHLDKELYLPGGSLKHQGSEDYFYGNDGALEDKLAKLEEKTAPYLKRIQDTNSIPPKGTEAYGLILLFTVILSARTKDAVSAMDEMTSKTINQIMKYDESVSRLADKYEISMKNSAAILVSAAAGKVHLAEDLRMKLLVNEAQTKFIFSDNPVVKYNQFLEQRKHPGGHAGIATKGLQIFFPVSPTHMLCFYDEWVYKIGNRFKQVLHLSNSNDIEQLNKLQVLNCFDHLYFNHEISEYYIRTMYGRAKAQRLTEYTKMHETNSYIDSEGREHIRFMTSGINHEINLNLTFIKQTRKAKAHVLNDYAAQLRNENLRGKQYQ